MDFAVLIYCFLVASLPILSTMIEAFKNQKSNQKSTNQKSKSKSKIKNQKSKSNQQINKSTNQK